jgi:hypothetical protein
MRQEDYNDMMRFPWESRQANRPVWSTCPTCKENYTGDGVNLCVECKHETENKSTNIV